MYVCVCVCTHICLLVHGIVLCGGQGAACRHYFFPFVMWVPRMEFRTSGLPTRAFTSKSILLASGLYFKTIIGRLFRTSSVCKHFHTCISQQTLFSFYYILIIPNISISRIDIKPKFLGVNRIEWDEFVPNLFGINAISCAVFTSYLVNGPTWMHFKLYLIVEKVEKQKA